MNNQIQRSECLYNGEIIGIESIFTVINGKQINIPDKVEALREKGRRGLLQCPCGCGTKLILVAGDQGLRQQHFRARNGESWSECTLKQEGMNSIDSKIIIKCWLADKIDQNVETRVLLSKITNTDKKYEVSHYIPSAGFAVNYTNLRVNLEDGKLEALDEVFGNRILYIVDTDNLETFGQYPEYMNKIQKRQNYCLFLKIEGRDYDKAILNASFYMPDLDGIYQRIELCEGLLKNYSFSDNIEQFFNGQKLSDIYKEKREEFLKKQEDEKNRRDEEAKQFQERQEKLEAERKRQEAERKAAEKERQDLISEYELQQEKLKKQYTGFLTRSLATDNSIQNVRPNKLSPEEERIKIEKEIEFYIDKLYLDSQGARWFKCTECGSIGKREDFEDIANARGTCKKCYIRLHGQSSSGNSSSAPVRKTTDSGLCPWCGSELVKRNGPYGPFWGCSAYPDCTFKKKIY